MYPSARLLVIAATVLWTPPLLAAGKSEKADRVVEAVLQQEARGDVTRRADDLGGAIEQSDRARWAAGYVRSLDGWQRFDLPMPVDERIQEYKHRRGTETLGAPQHLALAGWSREHDLLDQYRAHLWAILASEPGLDSIWQQLGYEVVNGKWMNHHERSEAEIRMRESDKAFRKWSTRAKSLATRLSDRHPGTQALARSELDSIDDVQAMDALEAQLSQASADAAISLVDWLNRNPRVSTTVALVRQSIDSPWQEVRDRAADALRRRRLDHAMPPLLYALSTAVDLKVDLLSHAPQTGRSLVTAAFERETWNTVERRKHAIVLGPQLNVLIALRTGRTISTFWSAWQPSLQERNDLARLKRDVAQDMERFKDQINDEIDLRNRRVSAVLAQITGSSSELSPEEWWLNWSAYTATDPQSSKDVVEVSEAEILIPQLPEVTYRNSSCLPAGTLIASESGLLPIESIRVGDTVLAKDVKTGELSYKPVIRTTVRKPQPLLTLHTRDESIRATRGHYFWVSGKGWRMTKEIQPGDRLHGVEGTVAVTDVSLGGNEAVYNLVVEGANTYFVGTSHSLSHDVTPPVPTDIVVPGLAVR